MYRIGIIVRPKKTDALICQSLAGQFTLEIAQYGVPQTRWLPWILKRLRTAGFFVLLGHLELSLFIKCQQLIERFFGETIWERCGVHTPQWSYLKKRVCTDEQSLNDQFKNVDLIIALDAFRLSQSFFRGLHAPYFEIAWGDATKYLGDSAAFWEYAMGNTTTSMVSMIERSSYFNNVTIFSQIPVSSITAHETLRSLKVKQAITLSVQLPVILKEMLSHLHDRGSTERKKVINQCYAPTLWTYVKYRLFGLHFLPRYACRPKDVIIRMPLR